MNKDLWIKVGVCVLLSLLAGALGAWFTSTGSWYQQLSKPVFNPPSWVFGPVWTTLYVLMGVAAGLVWHQAPQPGVKTAMGWFWFQLALNALWSFSFFGLESPLTGLINIVLLLIAVAFTTNKFFKVRRRSGWLMVPYLAWVSFATLLNLSIWWLN